MRVFLASCCLWGKDSKKNITAENVPSLKAQLSKHTIFHVLVPVRNWAKVISRHVDLDETLFEDGAAAGVITIKVNNKVFIYLLMFTWSINLELRLPKLEMMTDDWGVSGCILPEYIHNNNEYINVYLAKLASHRVILSGLTLRVQGVAECEQKFAVANYQPLSIHKMVYLSNLNGFILLDSCRNIPICGQWKDRARPSQTGLLMCL